MPGRPGDGRRGHPRSRSPHRRPRRFESLHGGRSATGCTTKSAQVRLVGGHLRRPGRNRSHQHPPGDPAGHAPRCSGPRAPARCSFGRCLSNSVIADGPAQGDRRRSPGVGHRRGVDCRQSHAGSIDASCCTTLTLDTDSTDIKAMRRPITLRPLHGLATRSSIAARSDQRPCLITLSESHHCAAVRS